MQTIIPDALYLSPRPGRFDAGINNRDVPQAIVDRWIDQVRAKGIKRIICLLDEEQLAYYLQIPGGLVAYYRSHGFDVVHLATRDHQPVPPGVLSAAYAACNHGVNRVPTLVHCSAGAQRSREVVDYIVRQLRNGAPPVAQVAAPAAESLEARVEARVRAYRGPRSPEHFRRVNENALRIHDALQERHGLAPRFRRILWAAAMLHDVGTEEGEHRHGWLSADDILDRQLGDAMASAPEIALASSLHRTEGAAGEDAIGQVHPRSLREVGGSIPPALLRLAAILRVADGLDRHPDTSISGIELADDLLVVQGTGRGFEASYDQAVVKAGLLRCQFQVELTRRPPEPRVAVQPRAVALFDLQGTLVHHNEPHAAVEGMVELLQELLGHGWRIVILTRHNAERVEEIRARAGLPAGIEIRAGGNRIDLVRAALAGVPDEGTAYYIDDKPDGIRSVHALGLGALQGRIIPFVGSGRYAQEPNYHAFRRWCEISACAIAETANELRRGIKPWDESSLVG